MPGILKYNQKQQDKEREQPTGKFMGLIMLLWRKAWDLTKVNLISFLFYIPFFYLASMIVFAILQIDRTSAISSIIYSIEDLQLADFLLRIIIGTVLVTIPVVVFGPVAAGATYLYKSIIKGQPIFIWNDMWVHIKKFFVKGVIITVIDVAVLFITSIALQVYPQILSGFLQSVVIWIIAIFMVLFLMMHFYIYQLLIEYNLGIIKLYRYSFVFSLLRLFPNLLILIVCVAITLIPFALHILVGNGVLIFLSIAVCGIIINYFSWPAIEKHFEPLEKK
ncbi:MAG: hypothetical protein KAH14_01245 [Clostridiales bacterium]|nr:hypothetical protein [Clostridiales bacterium]